jgi:ferredoxin
MIVGDLKALDEILYSLKGYRKILAVGCGSCVTVCLSGGDREAVHLARELSRTRHYPDDPPVVDATTIERQCEKDFILSYLEIPEGTDAILSLACGAGVQTMASVFEPLPVIPALNTTFLGASNEPGVWEEMCRGCGDCMLSFTGGICPVARCAKSLFNGPCGGSQGGSCEIREDVPCAWALIYYRLKKQNRLDQLLHVREPSDWRPAGGKGPRERRRTGIDGSPGDQN